MSSSLEATVSAVGVTAPLWQYQVAQVSSSVAKSADNATVTTTSTDAASTDSEASAQKSDTFEKSRSSSSEADQLSEADKQLITALKARDAKVRAHEAAHQAAGGSLVGGASYTYQKGPDNKSYAVGGEVSVDTSPVSNNPSATIAKMRTVQAAALAPADPSAQDLKVAAAAQALSAQAAMELSQKNAAPASDAAANNDKQADINNADATANSANTTANTASSANTSINSPNQPTAQQRRGVDGYRQSVSTLVAQVTGSGLSVSA